MKRKQTSKPNTPLDVIQLHLWMEENLDVHVEFLPGV